MTTGDIMMMASDVDLTEGDEDLEIFRQSTYDEEGKGMAITEQPRAGMMMRDVMNSRSHGSRNAGHGDDGYNMDDIYHSSDSDRLGSAYLPNPLYAKVQGKYNSDHLLNNLAEGNLDERYRLRRGTIHGRRMDQGLGDQWSVLNDRPSETTQKIRRYQRPISLMTQTLQTEWNGPSWEKALLHADYTKPRKGGKGGKKFEFWHTTTGRHCCLTGCGEQCDLFREGQTSEFGIYGSGVSNYFKFLKWSIGKLSSPSPSRCLL